MAYVKIKFSSRQHGDTAGLVISLEKYMTSTMSELSRLYPVSESKKMRRFSVSKVHPDFDGAFNDAI